MSPTKGKSTSNDLDVYNPTSGPVFIDEDNRMIAGGEWASVPSTPEVKAALKAGALIEPGKIKVSKKALEETEASAENEDDLELPVGKPDVTVSTVPPEPTSLEK